MRTEDELRRRMAELEQVVFSAHDCTENRAIRVRTVDGGARHIVWQCQVCGAQKGGPLSKARAAAVLGASDAPAFDEALTVAYSEQRRSLYDEWADARHKLVEIADPEALRRWEAAQLEAVERAQALKAAQERVRSALDTVVREAEPIAWNLRLPLIIAHLQSAHAGAFRDPAARAVRRFESEPELRDWLDAWIEEDFSVVREVPGRHLTEGTRVKLDYVLTPRDHLVRAGFKPGPIGLEVKHLPVDGGLSPKASRFVWQAVSYTDCEFEVGSQRVRLPRVLLFSNLSFDDELAILRGMDHSALGNDRVKWTALLELANHANVGNFKMYGRRDDHSGWRIAFATGTYFRRRRTKYSLSDANLFEKVRVGNF